MSKTPADPPVEFRRIPTDRLDEYQRIVDYAFGPEDAVPPDPAADGTGSGPADTEGDVADGDADGSDAADRTDELGDRFGVFDGPDLRSVCKHYDFTARLRGEWVPLAGLASVATPPENRRQGYVRHLVDGSLERWREEYPLAALWPFDRGYYRQFGWATANKVVRYVSPPEQLGFARERASGTYHRVTADEWGTLQDAHERHAADRTLTLRRDEDWWREKVFQVSDDDRPHVYAWERDGHVRGYVAFTFQKTGDGMGDRRLRVSDLAFADHDAYCNLLRLLADHDSQVEEVVHLDGDDSLLDLVDDPSEVESEVHAGPMVRVVDVCHALSTVPYPEDATADLTLAVTDETAAWNDDVFRLTVTDGAGDCTRSDTPPVEADAAVDVGTLSQLVIGYHSVADARRLGGLSVRDESAADRLSPLFPLETVYLRTFF